MPDGEGGEHAAFHHDNPDEAVAHLYGDPDVERDQDRWLAEGQRLDDGRILCGPCNTKRLCAERGHRWGEWRYCYCDECDPWNDAHRVRSCVRNHCDAYERRATVVEAVSA